MKNSTKIWLIAATVLLTVGLAMLAVLILKYNWDFDKLSAKKFETNSYNINDEFNNISINTNDADITFALAKDGKCKVECYEETKAKHSVEVRGDTLFVNVCNEKAWYDYIGIYFKSAKITVYLPENEYSSFVIKGTTSDICIENIAMESLNVSVSTGDVTASDIICGGDITVGVSTGDLHLTNIVCKNVISQGSTGDILLKNVIASEKFSLKRSTGDIEFDGSDAAEIFAKTTTGDVTGSLLSEKVFTAQTGTGTVKVPKSTNGGKCEINTSTGDIKIKIK
ncbi:MAG: DUF4097 family beta strand repeat protein [Clostridia bacterium]|nr:DUF4097 family beta strand repeat protein [Clostridia bacterium]